MRAIFRKGIPLDADGDGLTLYPGGDISLTNAMLTLFLACQVDAYAEPCG